MILLLPNSSNQNPSLRDFVPWKEWSMNKILGSWNSGLMISFCRCWGHEVELRHFAGCCSNFPPWRSQSSRLSALIVAHSSMQPAGTDRDLQTCTRPSTRSEYFESPAPCRLCANTLSSSLRYLVYPPIFIDPLSPARDSSWYGPDWNGWINWAFPFSFFRPYFLNRCHFTGWVFIWETFIIDVK